jgi:hypothetical protein
MYCNAAPPHPQRAASSCSFLANPFHHHTITRQNRYMCVHPSALIPKPANTFAPLTCSGQEIPQHTPILIEPSSSKPNVHTYSHTRHSAWHIELPCQTLGIQNYMQRPAGPLHAVTKPSLGTTLVPQTQLLGYPKMHKYNHLHATLMKCTSRMHVSSRVSHITPLCTCKSVPFETNSPQFV